MAITKTARTLVSSQSVSAGNSVTGSALDLRNRYGCEVTAKVANGSTGPTTGCVFKLEVSTDNSNWFEWFSGLAKTTNNETTWFNIEVPAAVMYLRASFAGHTGQAVTVEALAHEMTTV
jgi:hypothetical protein